MLISNIYNHSSAISTHGRHNVKVSIMNKVLKIVVISLLLSFNANADDISDFQIEGISIGDSLLKFVSKKDIKKSISKKQGYKDKSFVRGVICDTKNPQRFCKVKMDLNTYDAINFHFKKKDSQYVLFNLGGILDFDNKIDDCKIEKSKTVKELTELFPTAEQNETKKPHPQDKSNKSMIYTSYFYLNDGSASRVQCYDWSKKTGWTDHLKITLDHPEYIEWAKNKAWK